MEGANLVLKQQCLDILKQFYIINKRKHESKARHRSQWEFPFLFGHEHL